MKIALTICCLCSVLFAFGQGSNSTSHMQILQSSDWCSIRSWFGDSIVNLKPKPLLPDLDTAGHTHHEMDSILRVYFMALDRDYGERLHFDHNGTFSYSLRLYCAVGETLYDITDVRIADDIATVTYCKYEWNATSKVYTTSRYRIATCTPEAVKLVLL